MLNERSMTGSTPAKPAVVSGRHQTGRSMPDTGKPDAGMIVFPALKPKLSDRFLARHLADVALLARTEGDVRMAEHLVDVAYHLATDE